MKSKFSAFIFVTTLSLLTDHVSAGSFSVLCDSPIELARRGCTIKFDGEIRAGDAANLRNVISKPLSVNWHYNTLLLKSPGGSVQEALLLAQVVKEAMLSTSTERNQEHWRCISACFLVWVSGTERFSYSGSMKQEQVGIGLHRPYFPSLTYTNSPSKVAEMQQNMTTVVRDYLRREQVPEPIVEKMLQQSSREIYWLGEEGDSFALNGRSAWFEEMMIAKCGFDPVYDRDIQQRMTRQTAEKAFQKRGLGERPNQSIGSDEAYPAWYKTYLEWRRQYHSCEYLTRSNAQLAFRH